MRAMKMTNSISITRLLVAPLMRSCLWGRPTLRLPELPVRLLI